MILIVDLEKRVDFEKRVDLEKRVNMKCLLKLCRVFDDKLIMKYRSVVNIIKFVFSHLVIFILILFRIIE